MLLLCHGTDSASVPALSAMGGCLTSRIDGSGDGIDISNCRAIRVTRLSLYTSDGRLMDGESAIQALHKSLHMLNDDAAPVGTGHLETTIYSTSNEDAGIHNSWLVIYSSYSDRIERGKRDKIERKLLAIISSAAIAENKHNCVLKWVELGWARRCVLRRQAELTHVFAEVRQAGPLRRIGHGANLHIHRSCSLAGRWVRRQQHAQPAHLGKRQVGDGVGQ